MKHLATLISLSFGLFISCNSVAQPNATISWNTASLQGIRDAKLGAPVIARALAIVHTCMYDAWAAYDERALELNSETHYAVPLPSER